MTVQIVLNIFNYEMSTGVVQCTTGTTTNGDMFFLEENFIAALLDHSLLYYLFWETHVDECRFQVPTFSSFQRRTLTGDWGTVVEKGQGCLFLCFLPVGSMLSAILLFFLLPQLESCSPPILWVLLALFLYLDHSGLGALILPTVTGFWVL